MQPRAVVANFVGHTLLFILVLTVACGLVYHYFYGENGYYAMQALRQDLSVQQTTNTQQQLKNARLRADVADLKAGLVAVEEHARADLGLIKPNEIFVQLSTAMPVHGAMPVTSNEPDAVEALNVDDIP